MASIKPSLKVGLLENAAHSLQRGYELWSRGQQLGDGMLLKEAIIWVHHGIELVFKQLLVQTNEYLVFDKVDEAIQRLGTLRRQPGMMQATVLDLFEYGQGAYTVGFAKLVDRVAVMLGIKELTPGQPLRQDIDDLTIYRNKIVHFSVTMNIAEVTSLLSDILEPLLQLLDREVNDQKFKEVCIPEVRRRVAQVSSYGFELEAESENRIRRLLAHLKDTAVPGELLGAVGEVQIPSFAEITGTTRGAVGADLEAKSNAEDWLIEVKLRVQARSGEQLREQLERYRELYKKRTGREPKVWLVVLSEVAPVVRAFLVHSGILLSTKDDLALLESLAGG
ncbi:MAG: hypothetical protein QOH06_5700 [Acidobacteriota bacterium]|jgi:hypothetical protein|nr:hypothetical protein [Acidobacteriota bacterium]